MDSSGPLFPSLWVINSIPTDQSKQAPSYSHVNQNLEGRQETPNSRNDAIWNFYRLGELRSVRLLSEIFRWRG
jgi:hypothetical protein